MKRKFSSILLTLCLLFAMAPVSVLAAGGVASVDGTDYPTLQAAIDAASQSGGTVILESDITESVNVSGGTVTLDLNSHTLTGQATDAIYVANGANLAITGTGTVQAAKAPYAAIFNNGTATLSGGHFTRSSSQWYTIVNHGTMTINDGVSADAPMDPSSSLVENGYSNYYDTNERNGYVAGTNAAAPALTINGGTFTSIGSNAVKNDEGGALEITGGTFSCSNAHGAVVQNWNQASISGGTFTANGSNAPVSNGYYTGGGPATGEMTITNGTFIAESGVLFACGSGSSKGGSLSVNGGEYVGSFDSVASSYYPITITSGTFTNPVPETFIPGDTSSVSLTTSTGSTSYYVGTSEEINEKVANAQPGDTVTLLNGSTITVPDGVTVKNETGNDITVNDELVSNGEEITAHTHAFSADWSSDEENHWHKCSGCDDISDKAAHTYGGWTVVKKATATEKGLQEKSCTVCGYKVSESIPATGGSNTGNNSTTNTTGTANATTPKTGDGSNLILWLALLVLSCGSLAGGLICYKKR